MGTYQVLDRSMFGLALFCSMTALSGQVLAQENPPMSEEVFWGEVPMVMSATRMSQSVNKTPVAVTVIDRRMIDASGAREIAELFRLVPGFIVGYNDGHTPSVSYHMSVDRYARQMQVLIDGRSVYTTVYGGIPWATLPITIDDIDRVEVVRGPNSASYGANSFLGVINIITRNPVLEEASSVKVNVGDGGVREVFLRHIGGGDKFDYRVTAGFVEDDGFAERYDSKSTQMLSVRGDYGLTATDTLSFEAGVGTGPREVTNKTSLLPQREKIVLNHQQQIKWERRASVDESLSVQLYHIFQRNAETFTTSAIPLGIQIAGFDLVVDPIDVDFSRYTHRYELGFQHNLSLTDQLRTAWGGGFRSDEVWGAENLMADEEISNYLRYGFMNLEWNPANAWILNAGAMLEDYSTTGTSVSPRLGVNYQVSAVHSMRLTVSKAVRTPSMFEYAALYSYGGSTSLYSGSTRVADGPVDVYEEGWRGDQNTDVEKITSYELGYHGMPVRGMVELDAKIYYDELTEVIDLQDFAQPLDNFDQETSVYVNNDWTTIRGTELEAKLIFADDSALYLGYAYTEVYDKLRSKEIKKAPQNSFSLLYSMTFDQRVNAGIGFYFIDRIQGWDSSRPEFVRDQVRRLDLKLAKGVDLYGYEAELALAVRNILGEYEEMEILRPQEDFSYSNEVGSSAYLSLNVFLN